MIFAGKKTLVYGLGKSGIAAGALLQKAGSEVYLYDGNTKLDKERLCQEIGGPCQVMLGAFPREVIREIDMVVLSPGVPTDLPEITEMKTANIDIIGEIELAYLCSKGEVLAITGTNGKTTTTALLGEIIKGYSENSFVVGNIGIPYTLVAEKTDENSTVVAEVSSFQLETIQTFHPRVSAILNISPDHLDRHHTMAAYIAAKVRITENQTEADYCVLNYEDEVTKKIGETLRAQVIYFSSKSILEKGVFLKDKKIVFRDEATEEVVCELRDLQVLGVHNYENVMAAVAMALVYKVPLAIIRKTLQEFAGVAHRIEFVTEKNGVAYYNDSKGTNPDAAIKAVAAMERPTVLIAGGYNKDADYREWIRSFDGKVKKMILLGDTKEDIARTAASLGFHDYVLVDSFQEAVQMAKELANSGDAVLLSPACASWGMFKNFEERGDVFKKLVKTE